MFPMRTSSCSPRSAAFSRLAVVALTFAVWCETSLVSGQGGRTDSRRVAAAEKQALRGDVKPNWVEGTHLWYRTDTGPGIYEFISIRLSDGQRTPLFDHARLAEMLAKRLNRPVKAEALPIGQLEFSPARSEIAFRTEGRRYRAKLPDLTLEPDTASATPLDPLPLDRLPRVSPSSERAAEIAFVNDTKHAIELMWLNFDGKRQSYGRVPSKARQEIQTFAGHIWIVLDDNAKELIAFKAGDDGGQAVIKERLENSAPKPRENGMKSPDGRWRAFIKNHDVYVRSTETNEERRLSRDGTPEDRYEEPLRWSPDGSALVAMQVRPAQKHPIHLIESSPRDQVQPKLHTFDYLKPGDRIARPRPRLFDVAAAERIDIDDGLFAEPWSISELRWRPDSSAFDFLYNRRGHQLVRVVAVERASGKASTLIEDNSATFVDYAYKIDLRRLERTNEILWMSERDGRNHLWLFDARTGQLKNRVTQGDLIVRRIEHLDETARQVWFYAGGVREGEDPYQLHLCRVDLDGSNFTVLTHGDGNHTAAFSPDRQYFLDTWSRPDRAPVSELRRARDGGLVCVVEQGDATELVKSGWTLPERFVAKGRDGKTDIHGILIRPTNFDPNKKYPVVEEVYAGPQGQYVPKDFRLLPRHHRLADLGFVVVQADGMGTNWRTKAFHDVAWKNLADAGFADRIAWMRAAAKTRPWMDLDRVGIYGGSAGGQNAMRALIDHHDFYKVAVADCGCHDNRMDKIWWNELWMGWPVGPEYEASSNVVHAAKMQGNLMLIVGELDRNVDPASTMQVARALQQANKDFELVVVAGAGHGAAETEYGGRKRTDFLVRHLLGTDARPVSRP